MNEEHFLTELKIYLSPLSKENVDVILTSFMEVFEEGKKGQMSEEEIAKSLGKPKEIAEEILQTFHITVKEKKIYQNDWQEIEPEYYQAPESFEDIYPNMSSPSNQGHLPLLPRILLLIFNVFVGFWVIFGLYAFLAGAWMTVIAFFISPFLSLVGFLFFPFSVNMFQLSFSLLLAGIAFFMVIIGRPITKFIHYNTKRYLQFSKQVWKGDI